MSTRVASPFVLVVGGLAVVLVPLLALPSLRRAEAEPFRPGEDAVCAEDGGGAPFDPSAPASAGGGSGGAGGGGAPTFEQVVPVDGGIPTFGRLPGGAVVVIVPDTVVTLPEGTGGTGGTGGTAGTDGPERPTPGVTLGTAPVPGGGTDGIADGGTTGGATGSGTDQGVGAGTGTTTPEVAEATTTSTIAPEEVVDELVEEDQKDTANPFAALFPLLLVVAAAAVVALLGRRRRADGRSEATDPDDEDGEEGGPDAPIVPGRTSKVEAERRLRREFVRGLRALDRAQLVPFDAARPSGAVARRLRRPRRDHFLHASGTFDAVVYGQRPATEDDVDQVRTGFQRAITDEGDLQ